MAFAGTYGFGENEIGVLTTIHRSYAALSFPDWIQMKLTALHTLVVGWRIPQSDWNWIESFRWRDFFFVVRSLGLYSLLVMSVLLRRSPSSVQDGSDLITYRACRSLASVGLFGLGVSFVVLWGPHLMHHEAYAALLVLYLSGIVGSAWALGWVRVILISLALLYTVIVWILDPVVNALRVDWAGVAALSVLSGFAAYFLMRLGDQRVRV